MKPKTFAILAFAILLCSCATAYQPRSFTGGFSDIQIDQNTVRVSFRGNAMTGRDTVETYMLYRCAEITLEKGFDYFVLVDGGTDVQHDTHVSQGSYQSSTTVNSMGSGYATANTTGTYTPGTVTTYRRFGSTSVIKMFNGEKPANAPNAYTAQEVKSYLDPRIKRN
jgi:hypothetical protein